MTDDGDESVSWYKNTPNKKFLYIVFNQENTPIMPALCSMLQHTYYAQNYASIMCLKPSLHSRAGTKCWLDAPDSLPTQIQKRESQAGDKTIGESFHIVQPVLIGSQSEVHG